MTGTRLQAFREAFQRAMERAAETRSLDDLPNPRFSADQAADRLDPAKAEEWLAFDAAWDTRRHRVESDRELYEVAPDFDDTGIDR